MRKKRKSISKIFASRIKSTFESPIEEMLYVAMLNYGLLPICQYEIPPYRVDFAFIAEKLIVEADGRYWHSKRWQKRRDARREAYLKKQGWRIIRFTGSQIWNASHLCALTIRKELRK